MENLGHCPDFVNCWVEYVRHQILVPSIDCDGIEGSSGGSVCRPQGHVGTAWENSLLGEGRWGLDGGQLTAQLDAGGGNLRGGKLIAHLCT